MIVLINPNNITGPMHIVFLKFSANKSQASRFMDGHKAWIKRGFDDGVFLLAGSLEPGLGGGLLAHNMALASVSTERCGKEGLEW